MKAILLALFATAALFAADATGTWTGTLTHKTDNGGDESSPVYIVLVEKAGAVTGTAGPDPGEQHEILNGKSVNGEVTFEIQAGEAPMKIALKQHGEKMEGKITREGENGAETATLSIVRKPSN